MFSKEDEKQQSVVDSLSIYSQSVFHGFLVSEATVSDSVLIFAELLNVAILIKGVSSFFTSGCILIAV